MNFETLLQAAEFVESSSGPTTKENQSNARGNISSHVFVDRRRVVSESDASERRRRPGGAGTRETHNKLEKNRRAHLKECFDVLKREVPTLEEKKTSNLNILRSAFKYIQTMKKEEEEHETEVDVLKMNNKTLAERLGALKTKTKLEQKASASRSTTTENATSLLLKNPTFLLAESVDSRVPPISVATQTTPNLDKDGTQVSSVTDLEEVSNTCVSTSSTDTGVEGDEADSKISICDDDDDEKTDTDDGCYDDDDDDNDIEIDVVGQDDSSSSDSLRIAVESTTAQGKINGEMDSEKRKGSSGSTNKKASKFTRKRSKSERKCEEADSDYDENTKEEPKAKIQACARVSV